MTHHDVMRFEIPPFVLLVANDRETIELAHAAIRSVGMDVLTAEDGESPLLR